ncbi:MAG: phosphoesterase [Planctomycetes bacterium]|nr:phosphoesterase [Planctomycetota bacterium]
MNHVPDEHVLVVPRDLFDRMGAFQGFCGDTAAYLPLLLDPTQTSWRPRASVEEDRSFKQLIPYCLLTWRDADGRRHYFAYTRGGGQGEARLRAKRSLGIGGHISSTDGGHGDDTSYEAGMQRELAEEIAVEGAWTGRCVGLINDDSNPVGSVHLGIVHLLALERPAVSARESGLVDCGFEPLETLLADRARFETWSQITLDALASGLLDEPMA